jgi:alcohol dehydrogenase (cytochrome c)
MATRRWLIALSVLATWTLTLDAQVTSDRLLRAAEEPQNWLTYSGGYSSQRHSLLTQVQPGNVKNLELKWILPNQAFGAWQSSPLVVNGIMYLTERPNDVLAVDARTGRVFWQYHYTESPDARVCCGANNRGVAILGETLYTGTLDGHLVALDATNGHPLWNITVADPKLGYSITMAPLIVKDKVLVGLGGGEYGIRGFIAAFDAHTGKQAWRTYTIPGPGEPGHETWSGDAWKTGGGSVWLTPSYDPALNLTYWGVGNPGPDWNAELRPGDNLYTDAVVAIDADTGQISIGAALPPKRCCGPTGTASSTCSIGPMAASSWAHRSSRSTGRADSTRRAGRSRRRSHRDSRHTRETRAGPTGTRRRSARARD